jgi:hypothetical protein
MNNEQEAVVLAEYLSNVYKPIKLTINVEQWRQLNYKNKIFSVFSYPNKNQLSYMSNDYIGIKFEHAFIKDKEFFKQPYIFMACLIAGYNYTKDFIKMDIFNENNQLNITLDTEGKLPNRWIRMINDFAFNGKGVIQEEEIQKDFWETKCKQIPLITLESFHVMSMKMMNEYHDIKVCKSPDYSNLLELLEMKENDIKSDFDIDININDEKSIEEIKNRVWYTKDCKFSKPAEIFFKSTSRLYSYHLNKDNFHRLAAYEGGIYFRHYIKSPWYQYKRKCQFTSIYSRMYAEIKGENIYGTNYDVSVEEIIILEETLKHSGAELDDRSLNTNSQSCQIA